MPQPYKFSGSRSAALLNQNPYEHPTQMEVCIQIMEEMFPGFCLKNNIELSPFEENAAMRFGNAFENSILKATAKKFNIKLYGKQKYFEKDYLTCHVDALSDEAIIEVKTTTLFGFWDSWGDEGTDAVPISYQLQVSHNMIVAERKKCIIPVLIFPIRQDDLEAIGIGKDNDFSMINTDKWVSVLSEMGLLKYYFIDRYEPLEKEMLKQYDILWKDYILKQIIPEPQTYSDLKILLKDPKGTIVATEEIERLIAERNNIKEEIGTGGSLAKRAEMIKVEVLDWMRKQGAVVDEESEQGFVLRSRSGKKLASWGRDKRGIIAFR